MLRAIKNPERVPPYVYNHLKLAYLQYVYGRYYTVNLEGFQMTVDLQDSGVSHQLVRNGLREPQTTEGYRWALETKFSDQEEVTVLDIGANIGYYALQPVAILGDRARVVAIEPVPSNVELLRENVLLNGYEDNITVVEAAVATKDTKLNLYGSSYSNLFTPSEQAAERNELVDTTNVIGVQAKSVEHILEEVNIAPSNVDVIRLDVDGFEHEILESARVIFEESSELLVNVEIHPPYLTTDELASVIDLFSTGSVEIISSSPAVDDLAACHGRDHAIELVLWID